jgi:hypothetical protein
MKKQLEKLNSTIDYLKNWHPDIPKEVFESLENASKSMLKCCHKKRCKHCDRHEHYDETLGVWKCHQCDKNPDNK